MQSIQSNILFIICVNINVNFNENITLCQAYYPARLLASLPSTLQIMFVLFLPKIIFSQ